MLMAEHRITPYQFGSFAILFASILWGTTGTAASFAPEISSLAIGAFSMGVGGLLQACFAYKALNQASSQLIKHKKMLLIGALALAVYPLAFYTSMRLAGVAVGTVISIATAPFFTVLLERLFSNNSHITKKWLISFVIGMVGIALLTFSESSVSAHSVSAHSVPTRDESLQTLGIVLGLVAGLTYATYSWIAKAMIDEGIPSQAALGSIFGLGALLLLPTLAFTGGNLFTSASNTLILGYMAIIPMCIAYIAFGFGLRHVKASSATLLTLFEPVVAAALAVLVVGEVIPLIGWFGMGLIVICLLLQSTS
ncbi:DMT family transporter [Vibrio sp. WJH972]